MQDKRVDVWMDCPLYIAIKARAGKKERTVSAHLRYLAKKDLEQSLDEEDEQDMGRDRVKEGED